MLEARAVRVDGVDVCVELEQGDVQANGAGRQEVGGGSSSAGRLRKLGRDGTRLLELIGERSVKGKATLEQLLAENFTVDESGEL